MTDLHASCWLLEPYLPYLDSESDSIGTRNWGELQSPLNDSYQSN